MFERQKGGLKKWLATVTQPWFLTAFFGLLPFSIYFIERRSGVLTTADEWYSNGGNHGPWRYGWEGLMFFFPWVPIAILTLIRADKDSNKSGSSWPWIFGFALIMAQAIICVLQFMVLEWTVG